MFSRSDPWFPCRRRLGCARYGDGPFDFDSIAVLEQWVEQGKAPDRIVAAHFPPGAHAAKPDRTRPLCPYPQVAKYEGYGSTDDASNFVCTNE